MTTSIAHPAVTNVPDLDELIARARELQPLIRKNAAQGDQDRRVVEESIVALKEAGMFKLLQPKRYGGYETSMKALVEITALVGEADGGTAWAVSLLNSGAWLAAGFPEQAQNDVWSDNPEALVSGVFSPLVEATKVPGGFKVTGKWFYNSGSLHADWAVLSMPFPNESGEVVDMGMGLFPRTEFTVEDTWHVVGMRASGSNCVVVEDVFVPDHRTMSIGPALEGQLPAEHPEETLYQSPLGPLFTIGMVGPQLGMGRAALELVKEKAAFKPVTHTVYQRQADSVAFQLQLAEASMMLATAELHTRRVTDDMDGATASGVQLDFAGRARIRADIGWAIENVAKAINVLLYAHGAGSFAEVNPLQRIWRDSTTASRHAGILPAVCYEVYGKSLVGSEERITPII